MKIKHNNPWIKTNDLVRNFMKSFMRIEVLTLTLIIVSSIGVILQHSSNMTANRAYLSISSVKGVKTDSKDYSLNLTYELLNSGKTPATNVKTAVNYVSSTEPELAKYFDELDAYGNFKGHATLDVHPAGYKESGIIKINLNKYSNADSSKSLYFIAVIKYKDIYGESRLTKVCKKLIDSKYYIPCERHNLME